MIKDTPPEISRIPAGKERNVRLNQTVHAAPDYRFARNVTEKTVLLFVIVNLLFAWLYPMAMLGKISAYNHLFIGRERLPYGDNPNLSYNLSLYNLEAMFASHTLSAAPKPADEYRVILIGDSSTWGFLLSPGDTLSANMNSLAPTLPDGRRIRVYNLGYPVMSLAKDLLILSYALRYQPDQIVWLVTLESFPNDKQLYPPLLQNNPQAVKQLIQTYHLNLNPNDSQFSWPNFWDRTLVGSRRPLADLFRLQFLGLMWAATGIDQEIPETYTPRQEDLSADMTFHDLQPPHLQDNELAWDSLVAGMNMTQPTPMLLINEPIFVSQGTNSDIRYNFYYPRWAYDDYRKRLSEIANREDWRYVDFWNAISSSEFTNTAVHLSPAGSRQLAGLVLRAVLQTIEEQTK